MREDKGLVPELRFPEFVGDGEWVEKTLIEVCDITNGKANSQDHIENGKYPLFDRSELIKASNNFIFDSEAVIIPGEGMRFIPKYYLGKFNLHQRAYALKDFSIDGKFIYYSMLYRSDLLSQKAVRSTVLSLRLPILQNFPIEIPKSDFEQQKIASCLSSLDDLIAAHSQKLDLLKDHKKGLMQNLFPKAGETLPKIRFPEFVEDGDWMEKTLGEIGEFIGGGTPDTTIPEYWDGNILWYTPTEVKNGRLKNSNRKITEEGLKNSSTKILPKGTILITTRATIGDLAIANEECTTNQGFHSLIVNNSEINTFWYYWITSNKEELIRRSSGSTFKEIGKTELLKIPAHSPSKQEQQKIATCLSALDELITAQAAKIDQLQLHKKGLMQGLFPKVG